MALQLLRTPSLNELYSKAFGTGLQNLAQSKLQQLQQANQSRALQALASPDLNPQMRGQLAGFLSPEMQKEYFKSELKRPGEEAYAEAMGLKPGLRITEKQATELAKQQRSESKQEYEKAKPYIKNIRENAPLAQNLLDSLDRMQKSLESGNVQYGFIASKSNPSFLNEDTQNFLAAANDIVTIEADAAKGRPTDFKTRLIQGKKPSLEYAPKVNQNLIDVLRKKAQKQLNLERAYDEVSTKYGAKTPANLEQLIKIQAKKYGDMKPVSLPPISEYEEGDVIKGKDGQYHMVSNGEWIAIDESQL